MPKYPPPHWTNDHISTKGKGGGASYEPGGNATLVRKRDGDSVLKQLEYFPRITG